MLKIYGSPRSSAGRCFLMLEELGVPYEVMPLDMGKKEHKSEAYLKLNPNGKVPCLVDGDFVVWESIAINSYLADKFKPELLGKTAQERALVNQWNIWGLIELQDPMVDILIQYLFTPKEKFDMGVVERAQAKLVPRLAILNRALQDKAYLVGKDLTVADINLASMINTGLALKIPMESATHIMSWFNRMNERPAFRKFAELRT